MRLALSLPVSDFKPVQHSSKEEPEFCMKSQRNYVKASQACQQVQHPGVRDYYQALLILCSGKQNSHDLRCESLAVKLHGE